MNVADLGLSPAMVVATLLAGILAVPISAVVNRPSWSPQVRGQAANAIAIVLALVAMAVTDGFGETWYLSLPIAIGIAQALYRTLQPTGVVAALELATSPKELQTVSNVVTGEVVAMQVPEGVEGTKAPAGTLLPADTQTSTTAVASSSVEWTEPPASDLPQQRGDAGDTSSG